MFPILIAIAQMVLSAKMQHDAAKASAKAQNAQIEQQNRQVWQEQERRARQQRNLLERQKASARAAMGAMGTGGSGGSASALLSGMARDTETNIADDWTVASQNIRPTTPFDSKADALMRGLDVTQRIVASFPKEEKPKGGAQ